jgi:hypothetical protein
MADAPSITSEMDAPQKTGRQARKRGYPPYQRDLEQGSDEEQLMQLLARMAERWRPPETFSEKAVGLQYAEDPVGWLNKMRSAPGYEWTNPAGAFYGRPQMSPEAVLASQGNTAANQWAQLGAYKEINPDVLRQLNRSRAQYGSGRAYYGV